MAVLAFGAAGCLCVAGCTGRIGEGLGGSTSPTGGPTSGGGERHGTSGAGGVNGTTGGPPGAQPGQPVACPGPRPLLRAPLRRLTRFEYDNTVRDLLGDTTAPASALPAEELGNGFGNDAAAQAVSTLLAEQYAHVAEDVAARATATTAALATLDPCGRNVTAASEATCARNIINGLAPRAFRRPLAAGETDSLLALYQATRPSGTFAGAVAAVIEALLQSPEFLYRVEVGTPDPAHPERRRLTGDETATRLSYLLWGTMPDDTLRAAAGRGDLDTAAGVRDQATRMLADARMKKVTRYFFDNLLPINALSDLERDPMLFPTYTPAIGALMREETQRIIEDALFTAGSWKAALTSTSTFVNGPLAAFYGIPGVQGDAFQKVPLDPDKRLGFITQAGVMAGTTHSNHTSPVVRGSFLVQKLLCIKIPPPDASIAAKVKPPDPYSGKTARDRFTQHRQDPICSSCHMSMDPVGFALENFDPVGLYRAQENGVAIDASGNVPGVDTPVNGPVELVRALASVDAAYDCFAGDWVAFAYGRSLGTDDECLRADLAAKFRQANYDLRALLVALTQSDEFLYLPKEAP